MNIWVCIYLRTKFSTYLHTSLCKKIRLKAVCWIFIFS